MNIVLGVASFGHQGSLNSTTRWDVGRTAAVTYLSFELLLLFENAGRLSLHRLYAQNLDARLEFVAHTLPNGLQPFDEVLLCDGDRRSHEDTVGTRGQGDRCPPRQRQAVVNMYKTIGNELRRRLNEGFVGDGRRGFLLERRRLLLQKSGQIGGRRTVTNNEKSRDEWK